MPEPTPLPAQRRPTAASGTVHWIGTGLSTGRTGLELLCDRARRVLLWGRTQDRAAARLARLGLSHRAEPRALDPTALAAELRPGDVVVSMLPATEHVALIQLCVRHRAHFACSSYVSEEMRSAAQDAASAGLVVLTEAGLDPGIDHLMSERLVAAGRAAVGDTAEDVVFLSYCGGLPAVPNEFRYRFSWAPYGVLSALASPARCVMEGAERTVEEPWTATRSLRLGDEEFEVYPNRDSLPFVAQYGFPADWRLHTFVRGTLRNGGWRQAWEPVFETVRTGDKEKIAELAGELAARYPTTQDDRDRVVLNVALRMRAPDGASWQGEYLLDLTGTEEESAMARCVSLPLALGITRVLDGALPAGLNRAAESHQEAEHWMASLGDHGLKPVYQETGSGRTPPASPAS